MSVILFNKETEKLELIEKDNVIDSFYYLDYRIPTQVDIDNNKDKTLNSYLTGNNIIENIKNKISEVDTMVPLYDTYSDNLYLISQSNVYTRVVKDHYRFPDNILYKELLERKKVKNITDDPLRERKRRKLDLMLEFLSNFDLEKLSKAYANIFYHYSNEVGKNITLCKRPSFLTYFTHITPYYSRTELINLGLNLNVIQPSQDYYDADKIEKLCNVVCKNDIKASILMEHQMYLLSEGRSGIIQYYSLSGSYFMNNYLRNQLSYDVHNEYLEKHIKSLWTTIKQAPKFDQSYILYRFIEDDSYISDLNIGDVYIDQGFISTTRDPFYNSDKFRFGFILVKITIPANILGVALCIETVSHFPTEQEILLAPLSALRLEKKDNDCKYYHTDNNFAVNVKHRYEFKYLTNKEIKFPLKKEPRKLSDIDFLDIENNTSMSLNEKICQFIKQHTLGENYQFISKIGKTLYDNTMEWFNSTESYKKFYSISIENGFSIYNITNDKFTYFIELGENAYNTIMNVNYYFRFTKTPRNKDISDDDFVYFLSTIGYYFGIPLVIIYTDYELCTIPKEKKKTYYSDNYCLDIYNYLKYGKKRFNSINTTVIKPSFSYGELDRMDKTDPLVVLKKTDIDELYQIYVKIYKINEKNNLNLKNFYLWIVENHCHLTRILVSKLSRLYKNDNPFERDYYILDPMAYLYEGKYISSYTPSENLSINRDILSHRTTYRIDCIHTRRRVPPIKRLF